jgi:hypothetical protein
MPLLVEEKDSKVLRLFRNVPEIAKFYDLPHFIPYKVWRKDFKIGARSDKYNFNYDSFKISYVEQALLPYQYKNEGEYKMT